MNVEQRLYQEAKKLIKSRYPTGWSGAAVKQQYLLLMEA